MSCFTSLHLPWRRSGTASPKSLTCLTCSPSRQVIVSRLALGLQSFSPNPCMHVVCLLYASRAQHFGAEFFTLFQTKLCLLRLFKNLSVTAVASVVATPVPLSQLYCIFVFVLQQSLPDQDEKTMTCRSRGKHTKELCCTEYLTTPK